MRTPTRPVLFDAALLAVVALGPIACSDAADPSAISGVAGDAGMSRPAPAAGATFELTSPVFGLATHPDGSLVAAETLRGVTQIRKGAVGLLAELGGVSDVAAIGSGAMAITGEPLDPAFAANAQKLFRVTQGGIQPIADLHAFEVAVNPDQVWNPGAPHSNPFGIARLQGRTVLVADAAANSIVIVDENGTVDWVAVLTPRPTPTAPFKTWLGCAPGDPRPPCNLPMEIPAQPVATAVAVGPDGAYYAGELTGFPGAPGFARVWRIAPGSLHVICPGVACTLVADGFTSIMDLAFGRDGTLYVAEFDAAGWLAVEILSGFPLAPVEGGRVKACDVATGSCTVIADGLALTTALTAGKDGTIWVAENSVIPFGTATVRAVAHE